MLIIQSVSLLRNLRFTIPKTEADIELNNMILGLLVFSALPLVDLYRTHLNFDANVDAETNAWCDWCN